MSQRQYAYHCTNTDPEIIKRDGWKVGMGFTLGNFFDKLNKKYLPKVPVYVTSDTREVWDTNADYIIKLDITGLDLYPDFGSLPDTGAFYDLDEKYFHWYDDSEIGLTFTNTPAGQKMKEYLESISPDEYILLPDDFSGEDSMRILGTAVVDGSKLQGRIVSYTKKNDKTMKLNESTKVTLTLSQLKKLVKEASEPDQAEPQGQYLKCHKKEYSIEVYVPEPGTKVHNKLENSDYVTDEKKPFVLVGTAGEEWTVDAKKLTKTYTLDGKDIDDAAIQEISDGQKHTITTKADAGINWCKFVPKNIKCKVDTSWGETLEVNRSGIPHGDGDYIVTSDKGGEPDLSDRWVVNGEIFQKTYEILDKPDVVTESSLNIRQVTYADVEKHLQEVESWNPEDQRGKDSRPYNTTQFTKNSNNSAMEWWFAYDGKDLVAVVGMDPECKGEGEVYLNEIMAKAGGGYGVKTMKWLFDHYAKQPGVKVLSFDSWSADNMDKLSAHYEKNFPDFKKEKNSWGGYTFTKNLEDGEEKEGQEELDQVAEDTKFTLTIGQLKRLICESLC